MSRIGTVEAGAVTCAHPGIGHAAYRRRPEAGRTVLAPGRAGSRLAAAQARFRPAVRDPANPSSVAAAFAGTTTTPHGRTTAALIRHGSPHPPGSR